MPFRLKEGVVMAGDHGSYGPLQVLPADFDATALDQLKAAGQVEEVEDAAAEAPAPAPETATGPAGETAAKPGAPKTVTTVSKPAPPKS